jgi:hypothetical protein
MFLNKLLRVAFHSPFQYIKVMKPHENGKILAKFVVDIAWYLLWYTTNLKVIRCIFPFPRYEVIYRREISIPTDFEPQTQKEVGGQFHVLTVLSP